MDTLDLKFNFDNSYAQQLEGFYVPWQGDKAPSPKILLLNKVLAEKLGLKPAALDTEAGAAILAGSVAPEGAHPLAQAYAGHQFGGFSPQLGDGRALLLGEVIDDEGIRHDIQLKGSGRTPFSRGGDGKAVIGPVLREYLMGEAMFALGVPTTRALAAVETGEKVQRVGLKPGAVLARVASSHLRVGTFQYFSARGEPDKVKQLADYTIARHFPELVDSDDKYTAFLTSVADRQAALIARWMHVGFVHGVMNTDNTAISGETIDYGPCAFIDDYDSNAVFSSIDIEGRYAYGSQPNIVGWNLARLAETLLPLLDPEDSENAVGVANNVVNSFTARYIQVWTEGMREKIGLSSQEDGDIDLINQLFAAMEGQQVDYTQIFRALADAATGQGDSAKALFNDPQMFNEWLNVWSERLQRDPQGLAERAAAMNRVNPIYIPRNHRVEEALQTAESGDLALFGKLLNILSDPFTKRDGFEDYEGPAPADSEPYRTFCGT